MSKSMKRDFATYRAGKSRRPARDCLNASASVCNEYRRRRGKKRRLG